jgi:tRNA (Thr-GGU) A37 N-methylase
MDAAASDVPPTKKARKQPAQAAGQGVRANYFLPDDIVWVRARGYPLWPAEVIRSLDDASSRFECRLLSAPSPAATVVQCAGNAMYFFDKMATAEEVSVCVEARLNRAKHDVSAYESDFVKAVDEANRTVRIVLDASKLMTTGVIQCEPVGVVHSLMRTHLAAPRQPSVKGVEPQVAVIRLAKGLENAARDLKGFEWLWIVFHFSYSVRGQDAGDGAEEAEGNGVDARSIRQKAGFKCMIVPPRDTVARGVFATRSPHRPNSIGLSCVRLIDVRGLDIHIADHDLLHGTPVLDIKPYLPFCDAHPEAKAGWVDKLDASGKSLGDHRATSTNDHSIHRNYEGARPLTKHS